MAEEPAANDDNWEQEEGVPSLSDPFIQKYLAGRDALIEQEKKQRSGWSINPGNYGIPVQI
jgi:adenosine deaminase CECR1